MTKEPVQTTGRVRVRVRFGDAGECPPLVRARRTEGGVRESFGWKRIRGEHEIR